MTLTKERTGKITVFLFVLALMACNSSDIPIDTNIPICVQKILDSAESRVDLRTVRVQVLDNELHYWLNTDFTFFDGVEYIVNSSCDTICSFCGECFQAECATEYDDSWITIWEE